LRTVSKLREIGQARLIPVKHGYQDIYASQSRQSGSESCEP
jgi:hypothetical protein